MTLRNDTTVVVVNEEMLRLFRNKGMDQGSGGLTIANPDGFLLEEDNLTAAAVNRLRSPAPCWS